MSPWEIAQVLGCSAQCLNYVGAVHVYFCAKAKNKYTTDPSVILMGLRSGKAAVSERVTSQSTVSSS